MRTREEKYAASERIMIYLKSCSDAERTSLLDRLVKELGILDFGGLNNLMLNWDQIRGMSKCGISFGAHTVTHPVLTTIPMDDGEREISESKKTIEEKIGKPVNTFAFPFGKRADYKPEMLPILERLQFRCAVTTEAGINNYSTSLFELNRFSPWELGTIG
jgi:peptidoglycan/xylan/chitin deacetylase (PgdA/CDA1 family)